MRNKVSEAMSIGLCLANSIIGVNLLFPAITTKSMIIGIGYSIVSIIAILHTGKLLDESKTLRNNLKR